MIGSQEFAEWLAMYERDPWGDDWQQAAGIMSLITYGPLKKPMKPDEFIPGARARRPKQTPSQMLSVFKAFANFQNAKAAKQTSATVQPAQTKSAEGGAK